MWPAWSTSKPDVHFSRPPREKVYPHLFPARDESKVLGIVSGRTQGHSPPWWQLSQKPPQAGPGEQDVTLNHYLVEGCKSGIENTCCTPQTRELSLLNDITAGQEEFSSGGQKCLSWLVLWMHSSTPLFIVWVNLSCFSSLWCEIQIPLPCTKHIKQMKKTKLPTPDSSLILWIRKKMLFLNRVKTFYLVIPS